MYKDPTERGGDSTN